MNIFQLDMDPVKCAEYHVDRHAVKMILEYSQLLSTAHRVLDGKEEVVLSKTGRKTKRWSLPDSRESILYSATHINHPSAIWARMSSGNYVWLHLLLEALSDEYTYRYGKIHKCKRDGLIEKLAKLPRNIKSESMTDLLLAMPDEYRMKDPVSSYRNYYINGKKHLHLWKKRPIPTWIPSSQSQ